MDRFTPICRLVFSLLCLAVAMPASGVRLTITPSNPTEVIDRSVQFSCSIGPDTSNHQDIYVMDVVKDEKTQIAVIRSTGITFKHDETEKRYEAQGVMNGDPSQSYLNLTLLFPRVADSGRYSCLVSYLDVNGILKQDKHSAELVVKELEKTSGKYLESVVHSLIGRVESLESSVKQHEEEKQSLLKTVKKQKDDFVQKVIALERKDTYKSVFFAKMKGANGRQPLSPNKPIVFDDVVERQGLGYDETRGIFTAKREGLYSFHLTMGTWSKAATFTDIDLKVNSVAKTRLQTTNYNSNNGGNQDQTEVTLVTVLKVGDKVTAVPAPETTNDEQAIGNLCSFSGYLVQLYN